MQHSDDDKQAMRKMTLKNRYVSACTIKSFIKVYGLKILVIIGFLWIAFNMPLTVTVLFAGLAMMVKAKDMRVRQKRNFFTMLGFLLSVVAAIVWAIDAYINY